MEPKIRYEVVDVELAHVYYVDSTEARDAAHNTIELMGHRAIVREVKA